MPIRPTGHGFGAGIAVRRGAARVLLKPLLVGRAPNERLARSQGVVGVTGAFPAVDRRPHLSVCHCRLLDLPVHVCQLVRDRTHREALIEGWIRFHRLVELDAALDELTPLGFQSFDAHAATLRVFRRRPRRASW